MHFAIIHILKILFVQQTHRHMSVISLTKSLLQLSLGCRLLPGTYPRFPTWGSGNQPLELSCCLPEVHLQEAGIRTCLRGEARGHTALESSHSKPVPMWETDSPVTQEMDSASGRVVKAELYYGLYKLGWLMSRHTPSSYSERCPSRSSPGSSLAEYSGCTSGSYCSPSSFVNCYCEMAIP